MKKKLGKEELENVSGGEGKGPITTTCKNCKTTFEDYKAEHKVVKWRCQNHSVAKCPGCGLYVHVNGDIYDENE